MYAGLQCVCGIAFGVLFRAIVLQRDDEEFRQRAKVRRRRNLFAIVIYAASAGIAFLSPAIAILLFTAVSLAYVAPKFLNTRDDA